MDCRRIFPRRKSSRGFVEIHDVLADYKPTTSQIGPQEKGIRSYLANLPTYLPSGQVCAPTVFPAEIDVSATYSFPNGKLEVEPISVQDKPPTVRYYQEFEELVQDRTKKKCKCTGHCRFAVFPVTVSLFAQKKYRTPKYRHAFMLIIDYVRQEYMLFEGMCMANRRIAEHVGACVSIPDSFKLVDLNSTCPVQKGPQSIAETGSISATSGLCTAWSLMFATGCLLNPRQGTRALVRMIMEHPSGRRYTAQELLENARRFVTMAETMAKNACK